LSSPAPEMEWISAERIALFADTYLNCFEQERAGKDWSFADKLADVVVAAADFVASAAWVVD
jgi:hypothetical protein